VSTATDIPLDDLAEERVPQETQSVTEQEESQVSEIDVAGSTSRGKPPSREDPAIPQTHTDGVPQEPVMIYLNATQILVAQLLGVTGDVPKMSTQDINDKSKNVALMKIPLLYPIFHVIYTVLIRFSAGLPIS